MTSTSSVRTGLDDFDKLSPNGVLDDFDKLSPNGVGLGPSGVRAPQTYRRYISSNSGRLTGSPEASIRLRIQR